jgi:uncharacterized iron-regulated membrane protein
MPLTVSLPLRRVIFWLHLSVGLVVALIVIVMSATGVLLTYEKQMIRWADGYHTPPTAGQTRLPLETFARRAVESRPDIRPQSVILRADPALPVEVSLGREGTVFMHPYTGEVLGTGSVRARAFFRTVTDWHRWLGRTDDQRAMGRAVTGAANLGFFFIVVSGFYLWWPRTWTWTQFKHVLLFRRRLTAKARDFNWHNVIGVWSLVPLAVIVWSGVVISYPWASNLTYQLAGEAPPAPGPPGGRAAGPPRGGAGNGGGQSRQVAGAPGTERDADALALDPLVARAAALHPDWRAITVPLPLRADGTVALSVDRGTGAQPQKRGTLTLDAASAEVVSWEPFEAASRGRQWRMWLRFAHTGEWYGLTGQTIAGIVTLGSLVLVWTGVALSLRRFTSWLTRGRSTLQPGSARRTAA